jgi:hypothetical protein
MPIPARTAVTALATAATATAALLGAPTAQAQEQSNTLTNLPNSIVLADVDGEGSAELLQPAGNRLFVSRSNFEGSAVLHHYFQKDIRRLVVGDFMSQGREHGKDQVCAILSDDSFQCYAISDDKTELWWWFTQPRFFDASDRVIVGDFDGDGDDDLLAHNSSTGTLKAFTRNSTGFFAAMPGFALGNLADVDLRGKSLYAGEFGQTAGRDDLLVVDSTAGQVRRYDSVTDSAGRKTFWWAFTTSGGTLKPGEQVTVANLEGGTKDGLILRDPATGGYRFRKVEYSSGALAAGPSNVVQGQLPVTTNRGRLYTAHLKAPLPAEPGAATRHDTFFADLDARTLRRTSARWDAAASRYTYWWAYTKALPSLHNGWPALRADKWALLRCKFSDVSTTPQNDDFYRRLFLRHGTGGAADYFRDVSYGRIDITGSYLSPWRSIPNKLSESEGRGGTLSRYDAIEACLTAQGVDAETYGGRVLVLFNAEDSYAGATGNGALIDPNNYNVTTIAHEMLHVYGLGHSWDDTDNQRCGSWCAQPGEYQDGWDIMSNPGWYTFTGFNNGNSGPELNAAFKSGLAWLPSSRVHTLTPVSGTRKSATVRLAALNRPEADGALMVRINAFADTSRYYTVELRQKSGWDRGIPGDAVLVHTLQADGETTLETTATDRSFTAGETYSDSKVTVKVDRMDAAHSTATVTITY